MYSAQEKGWLDKFKVFLGVAPWMVNIPIYPNDFLRSLGSLIFFLGQIHESLVLRPSM